MFKPLRDPNELPTPGGAIGESYVLDFKKEPTDDPFEIAKDIAALANAFGGSLLIGAVEQQGRLVKLIPLSLADAGALVATYELAIRDRCRPAPQFSFEKLQVDGGFVVAINVWPVPGQPVGVRLLSSEVTAGKKLKHVQDTFYYPRRVGSNTHGVQPEQLPMLVDAKMRRIAATLAMAVDQDVELTGRQRTHETPFRTTGKVTQVDADSGRFVGDYFQGSHKDVSIPIDEVDAVWFDGKKWRVIIRGSINKDPGSPETRYIPAAY